MLMEVQVLETCSVAPSKKTPMHRLWLCSLDVNQFSLGHIPLVYLYRSKNTTSDFFDVRKLKAALSKTLVPFYPFAGKLDVDNNGRVEINCNDEGVLFVVARSEVMTMDGLKDMIKPKPSPELKRLFVPQIESMKLPCVVLAVQVTFLACGGVVIGLAIHHVAVDGPGTFHFLQTWSAFTRDGDNAVVELPCHDRTLLRSRSPAAVVLPDPLSVFYRKLNLTGSLGPIDTKIFSISKHQVSALKRLCGRTASTFCAVSAHLWQCMCVARRLAPDARTRLGFPVNIRRRVKPPLPDRYFGCAIVRVSAAAMVRDLLSEALASVAGRVRIRWIRWTTTWCVRRSTTTSPRWPTTTRAVGRGRLVAAWRRRS